MNDIVVKDDVKIDNMIFEVRSKQVIIDSEIYAPKCHYYLYDKIITHYDIGKPISIFNNFFIGGKIIWN